MKEKTVTFMGVNFDTFGWCNVPSPFSLEDFCCSLPDYWLEKESDKTRNLLVIEGLQSKEDWDLLKDKGLVPEDTKSCIVIITNEEAVAQYCEDNSWRKMDCEEREGAINAAIIGPFAEKEKYYSWGHDNRFGSHGWSGRIDKALSQHAPFMTPGRQLWLHEIAFVQIGLRGVNAVWGPSGVGKSALLRFLYCSKMAHSLEMIQEEELPLRFWRSPAMFERFGWVDVPPDGPFDLAEFSRRLLLDFNSYDPGEMEKSAVGIIQGRNSLQRCYEIMRKDRCLVVIDGLRSTHDWDSIKQAFLHLDNKSCVFVITTDESIAQHCITKDNHKNLRIMPVRALDNKSALNLFKKIVAMDKNTLNSDLASWEKKDIEWTTKQKLTHANRIVPKCGGLPKIIDAVAKSNRSFWENINDDLVTKLKNDPQFHHLSGVLSWMHSYFDGCSDSVKPYVFYLSVFPTNYKIRKAHLLRRWIAEGYSRDTISSSAKENAEKLFDELVKLGIIHELPSVPLCQISGFFREYIISQQMEDNLVFALEGNCKLNSQRRVQHLTIMKSWEREQENVFDNIDVSRLRSLTVYGKWESFFISDDKMKWIRVLDLEGTPGLKDCDLELIFWNLLSLKFICLRGCKSIKCLPKTLGGLRQLESLDVRGTSIVTLPQSITKLKKIQYIRAGMFLPFEDWTSAGLEDDSDDADGSQQPSGRTPTPPEAEGSNGGVVATRSPLPLISQANKQVDGARQKKLVGCCWTSTKSLQDSDDAAGSQQPPGTTATPEAEGSDGGHHQGQQQHHKQQYHKIKKVGRRWTSRLSSQLSPLLRCSWCPHNNNNGGVEVPKGIEDMPAMHTLGTVNINCERGMHFLTNLKTTLSQLLKLSVCGINKENWKDLCDALSSHPHLESLSLVLEEDLTEDMHFDNPPKALRCLRLYGHILRLPACTWIEDHRQVINKLEKFDLEVIISSQEDMDQLVQSLSDRGAMLIRRLCIKPTPQVTKLEFKQQVVDDCGLLLRARQRVLKIDCSSTLEVAFQKNSIAGIIEVLTIHCSEGSTLQISSNDSEHHHLNLCRLKTVWLKGYDEKADYVAHIKEQVAKHELKPVFMFEKLESA